MTKPTTSAPIAPIEQKVSALEKIKALQNQMEAFKAEGIAELKAQIAEKEQELLELRRQMAELAGEPLSSEFSTPRRKRGPNKPKDVPSNQEAPAPQAEVKEEAPVSAPSTTELTQEDEVVEVDEVA